MPTWGTQGEASSRYVLPNGARHHQAFSSRGQDGSPELPRPIHATRTGLADRPSHGSGARRGASAGSKRLLSMTTTVRRAGRARVAQEPREIQRVGCSGRADRPSPQRVPSPRDQFPPSPTAAFVIDNKRLELAPGRASRGSPSRAKASASAHPCDAGPRGWREARAGAQGVPGPRLRLDLPSSDAAVAARRRVPEDLHAAARAVRQAQRDRLDLEFVGQRHRQGAKRGDQTGPNPTDRAKSGVKRHILTDGRGVPLAALISGMKQGKSERASCTITRYLPDGESRTLSVQI